MRTSINIVDALLHKATRLTGIKDKTLLLKLRLEALIQRENNKKLTRFGGTEKKLKRIPRRRMQEL
jgi:hypothetical protein